MATRFQRRNRNRTQMASRGSNAAASLREGSALRSAWFSVPFFVAFVFVLFEYRPSSHLFGSVTVASRPLGAFLNVLVLALFFRAYAT
jgi:fumarate reductase subunit C